MRPNSWYFNRRVLRTLCVGHSALCRQRHSLCALAADALPGPLAQVQEPDVYIHTTPIEDEFVEEKDRPSWRDRLIAYSFPSRHEGKYPSPRREGKSSPRSALNRTFRHYLPYTREVIKELRAIDGSPTWAIVDDIILTGRPHDIDACPHFRDFEHIVNTSHFGTALSNLLGEGHMQSTDMDDFNIEELDNRMFDEDEPIVETPPLAPTPPPWLVVFMLATMLNTRASASEGVAFCLALVEVTPRRFRTPLVLLTMCALAAHNIPNQVPSLLNAFCDTVDLPVGNEMVRGSHAEDPESKADPSSETIIYQYNAILTLLSRCEDVPSLSKATIDFMRRMDSSGLPLRTQTAKKLIGAKFATSDMVQTITDILEQQPGYHPHPSEITVALARFYAEKPMRKRPIKALLHAEASRRLSTTGHLTTYLKSFHDAEEALSYLQFVEEQSNDQHDIVAYATTSSLDDGPRSPEENYFGPKKRFVYGSLLRVAAESRSISAATFYNMFITISAAHGNDSRLQKILLYGLVKRKAWDEGRQAWYDWEKTNHSVQEILLEMRHYLINRARVFGDVAEVRKVLNWSEFTEYVTWKRMKKMKVDAVSLGIAVRLLSAPKPANLVDAFEVLERYALKPGDIVPPNADHPRFEKIPIIPYPINSFMLRAICYRRCDVVFRVWDGMIDQYGVDPNLSTLILIIRAARYAASMRSKMRNYLPVWLRKPQSHRPWSNNFVGDIKAMLDPEYAPYFTWHDSEPWRVVRHIFREEVLFGNWPGLRHVKPPAQAIRADDATGRLEAFREMRAQENPYWQSSIGSRGKYPQLIPTQAAFKQYMMLLGRVRRSSEIPEVLAWMKALDIPPTRLTVAIALSLWSHVALESPIDESWNELQSRQAWNASSPWRSTHGGEYGKMIVWLTEWLGPNEIPSDEYILEVSRAVDAIEETDNILY